jgi:hypothetical protein
MATTGVVLPSSFGLRVATLKHLDQVSHPAPESGPSNSSVHGPLVSPASADVLSISAAPNAANICAASFMMQVGKW